MRVGEGHRRVGGHRGEEPEILLGELRSLVFGHADRADCHPVGPERNGRPALRLDVAHQREHAIARGVGNLQLLPHHGGSHEPGIDRCPYLVALEPGQEPTGGYHPEAVRCVEGECDGHAVALEEPVHVTRHLLSNPVQVDGVGEDVGQLLQ